MLRKVVRARFSTRAWPAHEMRVPVRCENTGRRQAEHPDLLHHAGRRRVKAPAPRPWPRDRHVVDDVPVPVPPPGTEGRRAGRTVRISGPRPAGPRVPRRWAEGPDAVRPRPSRTPARPPGEEAPAVEVFPVRARGRAGPRSSRRRRPTWRCGGRSSCGNRPRASSPAVVNTAVAPVRKPLCWSCHAHTLTWRRSTGPTPVRHLIHRDPRWMAEAPGFRPPRAGRTVVSVAGCGVARRAGQGCSVSWSGSGKRAKGSLPGPLLEDRSGREEALARRVRRFRCVASPHGRRRGVQSCTSCGYQRNSMVLPSGSST